MEKPQASEGALGSLSCVLDSVSAGAFPCWPGWGLPLAPVASFLLEVHLNSATRGFPTLADAAANPHHLCPGSLTCPLLTRLLSLLSGGAAPWRRMPLKTTAMLHVCHSVLALCDLLWVRAKIRGSVSSLADPGL